MHERKKLSGFTLVELLIVIVVIAILAAITIVAYNGITERARESTTQSELSQNARKVMIAATEDPSGHYATTYVIPGGSAVPKLDYAYYKVVTFCTNGTEFVLAAQTMDGKKYYAVSNASVIRDDNIDSFAPCESLGINSAQTTYTNLPSVACASENGTCTFSGTATIVYGSPTLGRFNRQHNMVSPVACNNTTFGDPASGYTKVCYVYSN